YREHHAGSHPATRMNAVGEVAEPLRARVEVGDHTVFEWTDRLDVRGRAADHAFGFEADGERAAVFDVDGDDRWFAEHDAASTHVDERVCCTEVDRHVTAHDRGERVLRHDANSR